MAGELTEVWDETLEVGKVLDVRDEEAMSDRHVVNVLVEAGADERTKQTLFHTECLALPRFIRRIIFILCTEAVCISLLNTE